MYALCASYYKNFSRGKETFWEESQAWWVSDLGNYDIKVSTSWSSCFWWKWPDMSNVPNIFET